jgi:hypothetical protein
VDALFQRLGTSTPQNAECRLGVVPGGSGSGKHSEDVGLLWPFDGENVGLLYPREGGLSKESSHEVAQEANDGAGKTD